MTHKIAPHPLAWLFAWFRPRTPAGSDLDPFNHPAIARMGLAELADLPFDAYALPRSSVVAADAAAGRKRRAAAKPGNACIRGARPV